MESTIVISVTHESEADLEELTNALYAQLEDLSGGFKLSVKAGWVGAVAGWPEADK